MPQIVNPEYLYLILLLPLLIIFFFYFKKRERKKLSSLGNINSFKFTNQYKHLNLSAYFLIASLFFLILSISRIKFGEGEIKSSSKSAVIAFVIDLSNSMRAEDIKPNRLERAKLIFNKIIKEIGPSRSLLIGFAQRPLLLSPLSSDIAAFKSSLDLIDESVLQNQGTDIGMAIEFAVDKLKNENIDQKAIIIASDGEDFENGAISAAKNAVDNNFKIFSIALGSEQGAPIPIENKNGEKIYIKNDDGETVISKRKSELLSEISEISGGAIAGVDQNGENLNAIFNGISNLSKIDDGFIKSNQKIERYQIFAGISVFLQIISLLIQNNFSLPFRKYERRRTKKGI